MIVQYYRYHQGQQKLFITQTMVLKLFLLNIVVPIGIWSLTANPTIAPNSIYSSAGSYTFDTSGYVSSGTSVVSPANFAITFPSRSHTSTNYHFGYTIQQISYTITSKIINYTIFLDSKTATSVNLKLYATHINKFTKLDIGYIIIEPLFSIYTFKNYVLRPGRDISSTTPFEVTTTGQGPFPDTSNLLYISIIGVDALVKIDSQIDLYAYANTPSTTSVYTRLSTISPNVFFMTSVMFSVLIYNTNALLTNNRTARWTTGQISHPNLNYANSNIKTYNSIYGLQGIHLKNQAILSYKTFIIDGSANAVIPAAYLWYGLNYLFIQFTNCAASTQYFMFSEKLCYDLCPIRYYADGYKQCQICTNYDCAYCLSNGSCTSCSSTLHFRTFNSTTQRCVPNNGYYDSGTTIATICNAANCLTCTSDTYCVSCATGKYLSSSNTCLTCMSNCLSCTSASNCQTCATFYVFNTNCVISCTISNCNACSIVTNTLTCTTCNSGYTLSFNTCTSVCGNGYRLSPQACDDGNTNNNDGCSSTCTVESGYYCTQNANFLSTCNPCISNCLSCTSASNCQTCATFYVFNTNCVISCTISNCNACSIVTNTLTCTTCNSGYTLSFNTCTSVCGNGYRLSPQACDDGNTNNNDGCSSTCTVESGYYCTQNANFLSTCNQCISNCQICINTASCTTCISGFGVLNNTCVNTTGVVCGNGILEVSQDCDDGNTHQNDGCNQNCKVEANYECSNTIGAISVCNIKQFYLNLSQIRKNPFSDSFVITYSIYPQGNNNYATQSWSSIITHVSDLYLNITSVNINQQNTALSINIQYSSNLNGEVIKLQSTFPNTAPFSLIASTPILKSAILEESYNLSLDVFPQEIYSLAQILQKVCMALSILSLIFFVIGFYSNKIIILECLFVFQIAFYSLICINELSPIQYSLTSLMYSTGVNHSFFSSFSSHKRVRTVKISSNFLNNYNFTSIFILLPFIISIVISSVNMMRKSQKLQKLKDKFRKQIMLYGIMFSQYTIFISLFFFLVRNNIMNTQRELLMPLGTNILFILLSIIMLISFLADPQSYGQFGCSFNKAKRYYGFVFFEKIILSMLFLIFLISQSFSFTLLVIITIVLSQIIIVCLYSPYSDSGTTIRPLLNALSSMTILFVQFFSPYLSKSISVYLPTIIIGILSLCLIYNLYYYFKENRKTRQMMKVEMINESFQQVPEDSKRKSESRMDINKNIRIFFNNSYGPMMK